MTPYNHTLYLQPQPPDPAVRGHMYTAVSYPPPPPQVRRVAYHNLLPVPAAGGGLFINNSSSKLAGHIMYWLSRLLLPRLLGVNAHTAARGEQRLLQEFDYLDSLLLQQQQKHGQQQQQGAREGVRATAAAGEAPAGAGAGGDAGSLPYYLLGPHMTVAGETSSSVVSIEPAGCCCMSMS